MPEMNLRQPNLHIVFVDHSLETKNEYKNLKKEDINDIFVKMN